VYAYVVLHIDERNNVSVDSRVFMNEYTACGVLDNVQHRYEAQEAIGWRVERESDSTLRVYAPNGTCVGRWSVKQLVID
jgi:hypothetical protein